MNAIQVPGTSAPVSKTVPVQRRVATVVVWAVWLVSLLAGFYLVWHYGSPVPLWDDYLVVPQLTGAAPITPEWLWEVHYSHRIPLAKIVFVVLAKLGGYDFRAAMYVSVLLLAALSAILIQTAKAVRGWLSLTDAFFPVLLLSYSNHRNMLWFWQVSVVIPIVLEGLILARIVRVGLRLSMREVLGIGVCLLLLPLCGSLGLIYVPPLALWLGYASWRQWREPDSRQERAGMVGLGFAAAAFMLVGLYYFHYSDPTAGPRAELDRHTIGRALTSSLQFLSTGWGDLPPAFFPISGRAMAAVLVISAAAFLFYWLKRREDQLRSWGLFMFLGAVGLLVVGVGWDRSGPNWDAAECLHPRYVTMMAPVLLWIYFSWCLFPVRWFGQWVQAALLVGMCLLLPYGIQSCRDYESEVHEWVTSLQSDMNHGVPASMLTERYHEYLYWLDAYAFTKDKMTHGLQELRDAGGKVFRNLRDDPEYQEVELPLRNAYPVGIRWDAASKVGQSSQGDSHLQFELLKPTHVYAVRLVIFYESPKDDSFSCTVGWGKKGVEKGNHTPVANPPHIKDKVLSLWIDDTIQRFRLYPASQPAKFRLSEIKLLIAPAQK